MRVMKFGGTSIANPERIRDVINIVLDAVKEEPVIVVVSAFQGVSNQLLKCAHFAATGDTQYQTLYQQIIQRHLDVTDTLLKDKKANIDATINQLFIELSEILHGIFLLKELTLGALDHIASFGERLSASIIASYLNQQYPAEYVDSRRLIVTDDHHTQAAVLFDQTNEAIRLYYDESLANNPVIPIITGFIGATTDGRTTTLGRNSSDYSAVIIGAALEVSRIEIWTDVDGVYSADPALVHAAFIVPYLSYAEAIELSYFGAKVIHPLTFMPVIEKQIPILIKNTLCPTHSGTIIAPQKTKKDYKKWTAKSITSIDEITLLIWQGTGISDASGTMERLFRSLMLANVNIFLILEASPNHTICLAISHKELEIARKAIQKEFYLEFQHQLIRLDEKPSQSIISIIGDEIKKLSPEIAGKMFQSLGRTHININAIVQGASERNFSLVIDAHQRVRALNLIHQAFFARYKNLALIIIGAGKVGTALLQQLHEQRASLLEMKFNISICAIANSRKMLLDPKGIDLSNWKEELQQTTTQFELVTLLKTIPDLACSNVVLVDCTASDAIVAAYTLFIQEGVHIITSNKRANVLPFPQYHALMEQFARHQCRFLYGTNVGAGLPVLTIQKDLLDCGDTIIKIEGIFSGTLSYLFNHYDGTTPFSQVLRQTQLLGMTEPDPREDLSGIDVGRKLVILARQMGWKMELEDVTIENLVPAALLQGNFSEQFYADYEHYEDEFKQRLLTCQKNKTVMRYIGTLQNHTASARLEEIPYEHPLALACHSDNIIAFTTHRYHELPLVIRGPGAGVEVTAMGVFSDILKLLHHLPG